MASTAAPKTAIHDTETVEGKPDPIDIHVGHKLRLRRMLVGMSQEKLGEAVGLTFQQIQKYERGANRIGASRLFRMAQILGIPVGYFYGDLPMETCGPGFAELGQMPLDNERFPDTDLLSRRETIDLVRAYYRTSPKQRRKILDLVKAMALADSMDKATEPDEPPLSRS